LTGYKKHVIIYKYDGGFMRVRISYSVDLDEVPEKAGKLLEEAVADLKKVTQSVESAITGIKRSSHSDSQTTDNLAECRQRLAKIDNRLSDISMVMSGYHAAIKNLEESEIQETVLDEEHFGAD
jgi:DNA repair ATPase RecN